MKKILSVVFAVLVGGIIGFVSTYVIKSGMAGSGWSLDSIAQPILILLIAITIFFLLISTVHIFQMKEKAKTQVDGDAEDEKDKWLYKKFSDTVLTTNTAIILSLTTICIAIITDQSIALIISGGVLIIISTGVGIANSKLIKIVYKDRMLPSMNDKDYSKKLLAMADEGERHVMLEGLYKTYELMNILLPSSILLLMFYSEFSGETQLFSIFLISIITIVLNARYILKIRSM